MAYDHDGPSTYCTAGILDDTLSIVPNDSSAVFLGEDLYDAIHLPAGYWHTTFRDPQATAMTMYSDTARLSPSSPFSAASDCTAVGSPLTPIHYDTGTPSHPSKPFTYVAPSTPYTGLDAPAFSSPPGDQTTYGQPQQQHLPDATAVAVPGDTSMQVDPPPLIPRALDVRTTPESPTASLSSRSPTCFMETDGVKLPTKRRRRQDTTKRFQCPFCSLSMSTVGKGPGSEMTLL